MIIIENWTHIRKVVMDLDDYVCRICFKDTSVANLHVHHMDHNRANNQGSNLVTLCQTCHSAVHREHYRPADHDDWPPPWKIERPPEDEFDLIVEKMSGPKAREAKPRKPKPARQKSVVRYWNPGYWPIQLS